MMRLVLGIGYPYSEYDVVRCEWKKYSVDFHFVYTIAEAMQRLQHKDYVCISIYSDNVEMKEIDALRKMKVPPIVMVASNCDIRTRAGFLKKGAADFILHTNQHELVKSTGQDAVQFYLDNSHANTAPLTIITDKDLYFCLEYRTIKVCEQEIELAPLEFDALYLFLSNKKRVLTFETIALRVWGDEYYDLSRKAVNNLICRLRVKLKTTPCAPNYIKNIHGIGYKFDSSK